MASSATKTLRSANHPGLNKPRHNRVDVFSYPKSGRTWTAYFWFFYSQPSQSASKCSASAATIT